jgi:hypothetical protein
LIVAGEFLIFGKSMYMPAVSKSSSKKKTASDKKKSVSKADPKIKYSDKSAGQAQLVPIFEEITKLLSSYNKGTMKLFGGTEGKTMLISKKPVEIVGKKKKELWFASALVQKGYVGFYYMPVYSDNTIKKMIRPELLKCLKGKACFHIKKFDKEIFSQIKEALKIGYDSWHKRGWI